MYNRQWCALISHLNLMFSSKVSRNKVDDVSGFRNLCLFCLDQLLGAVLHLGSVCCCHRCGHCATLGLPWELYHKVRKGTDHKAHLFTCAFRTKVGKSATLVRISASDNGWMEGHYVCNHEQVVRRSPFVECVESLNWIIRHWLQLYSVIPYSTFQVVFYFWGQHICIHSFITLFSNIYWGKIWFHLCGIHFYMVWETLPLHRRPPKGYLSLVVLSQHTQDGTTVLWIRQL